MAKLVSVRRFYAVALALLGAVFLLMAAPLVRATNYGSGSYGACQYQSCSISISSSGSPVTLPLTPSGTTCSVASDTALVTTGSSSGYTLQLSASDSTNALSGGAGMIPASANSFASPGALAANTWGYRVDGAGNFGAGPTSAVTNGSIPAQSFAGVPVLASPHTLKTTAVPAASGDSTNVWYGACVNSSTASGSYSDNVTYTAVVN